MRTALAAAANRRAGRVRAISISPVPPSTSSQDYHPELAAIAASILYRSPVPAHSGRPLYILNAAAFPDAFEVDYDTLLSYVLARLPGEDELLAGTEYEIIFLAGGPPENATTEKKQGPGMGWYLQAYHVLSRALRKKLQRLYIVHPRTWVRVLVGVFGTVVSPKFRRKIITCNTLSALALQIPVDKLLIPPSTYLHDRKLAPDIDVPYASGRRAFGARHPLPKNITTGATRLPRVLRETTTFLLLPPNIRTEGVFRIPPHSVLVGVLKEAYDRAQKFIVWKEPGAIFVEPGLDYNQIAEVRIEDAYGVHLAASLIKTWYRELREPIFSEFSYDFLREHFSAQDTDITAQALVDLLKVESAASPLSQTSKQIVTRHLLPLLWTVRGHESDNKMNAENLAICFAMGLVCGSNQMEDAKMSTIVIRILRAAINLWPQIQQGLGLDQQDFFRDIQIPYDHKDYEDPLEDYHTRRLSEDDAIEGHDEQRIMMNDASDIGLERAPTLPPRPRPKPAGPKPPHLGDASLAVRRKPAPSSSAPSAEQSPHDIQPPRYSTMFDTEGNIISTGATSSLGTSPGAPLSRIEHPWSSAEAEKKGFAPAETADPATPELVVPKRKAVPNTPTEEPGASTSDEEKSRSGSESSASLAKQAAQKAASSMLQRIQVPPPSTAADVAVTTPSPSEPVFRKPSIPASASRQQPPSNIHSLARPVYPSNPSQANLTPDSGGLGRAASLPKLRAPSPGLLARMNSMESPNGEAPVRPSLAPGKLNLRKTSVDDLRRLYEERSVTVQSLAQASTMRRGSSVT